MLYCSAEVGEGARERDRDRERERELGEAGQCCVWLRLALVLCSLIHRGAVRVVMHTLDLCIQCGNVCACMGFMCIPL